MKTITCNTGGADGADTIFENESIKYGISVISWSFYGHRIKSNNKIILNDEQLLEGWEKIKTSNKSLKRNIFRLSTYVKNLLSRNWFQVKNSDVIYAVSSIQDNMRIVDGGTGWAVQMAIDNNKEVYVFDQYRNYWYKFNFGKNLFELCDVPKINKNFAGIGTRELNINGYNAIINLFESSKKQ